MKNSKLIPGYYSWFNMKQRCFNPNRNNYYRYGGRGITVCERWSSFDDFFADMGVRPQGLTLNRIDTNGNYTPDNCEWATVRHQSRNIRTSRINNTSGYKGVSWLKHSGKWRATIRLNGKSNHIGCFDLPKDAAQGYDDYIRNNKLDHTVNFPL